MGKQPHTAGVRRGHPGGNTKGNLALGKVTMSHENVKRDKANMANMKVKLFGVEWRVTTKTAY